MRAGNPPVARTRAELAAARTALPAPVGVVMTMGALHEGHVALLRTARAAVASVVATIFVNPMQFGPSEDFARYPRAMQTDLEICGGEGVDLVFAPEVGTVYPDGIPDVTVHGGALGGQLEGAFRPGHFDGVLTVVLKLLHLVRPHVAFFGQKDFQQLVLVRRMVADLDVDVEIVGVPIVREPDGLALSSRNAYLDPDQRRSALALSAALRAGSAAADAGAPAAGVLAASRAVLAADPRVQLDYLELRSSDLAAATVGPARLLVAARVGSTRLIDNVAVTLLER